MLSLFAFQLFRDASDAPSQIVVDSALLRVKIIKQDVFGTAIARQVDPSVLGGAKRAFGQSFLDLKVY